MIHLDLKPEVEAQLAAEVAACPLEHSTEETEQRRLDLAALADPREGIRQGLEQFHRSEGRPAKKSSRSCIGSMAYMVRLAERAVSDLADIYRHKNAEIRATAPLINKIGSGTQGRR